MMKWTETQDKAITIPVSDVIVSAAAGSGKTAVMAERIMRRLTCDNYVDIDKILVVTYTNAAASEIKERVMKTIVSMMSERNSDVLQRQLVLIDSSHFCTIHSFCLELIKKYFYMLGLDPQVKTGDPADLKIILDQAISNVFDEYFKSGDKNFDELIDSYGNSRKKDFEKVILDIYNFSRTMPDSDKWLDSLSELYKPDNSLINSCIINYAFVALSFVKDELSSAITLIKKYGCCVEWLQTLENELGFVTKMLNCKNDNTELFKLASVAGFERLPSAKTATDLKLKNRIKSLRDSAKKEALDVIEKLSGLGKDLNYGNTQSVMPIINKIIEIVKKVGIEYQFLKKKNNLIDFADYEHMALRLLKNDDGTPTDIARTVAESFEEIYIDEYQDCNNIQNEIFKYISGGLYGRPNLFCVGDMKQSIYKFRDANPLNFKEKCDISIDYDGSYVYNSNKILLNSNFRSRKSILDYVNSMFYQLMSETCGELDYNTDEALVYGAKYSDVNDDVSSIDIDIINESDDFGDGCTQITGKEFSKQDAEIIHIARKIKNMVESGYMLYSSKEQTSHKASYGDIAVLFRSPGDYTASIEKIFADLKIPHTCDIAGNFFDTAEVGFLVALLKIIDNPDDDISIVTVLKNPIFGFDENMLLKIKLTSMKKSFYESIKIYMQSCSDDVADKLKNFTAKLDLYHEKSKYTELGDFILYLIDDLKYFTYIASFPDSEIKKNNVRIFINKANEYEKDSFKGVFRFIKYIENIKHNKNDLSAKAVSDNDNVVRIMSIHKSKGLEFPIVFLAGTGKKYNTTDTIGRVILHKDLGVGLDRVYRDKSYRIPTLNKLAIKQKIRYETMSEELRVLYVALTRPTEKLIITGTVKNGSSFLTSVQNSLQSQQYKINPYLVVKSGCFLETILLASMRHEKFEIASDGKQYETVISDDIKYNVSLINKSSLAVESHHMEQQDWKLKYKGVTNEYNDMVSSYNYDYPYVSSFDIPGNLSVTEIKKIKNSDLDDFYMYDDHMLDKPSNFSCKDLITGSAKGTLLHFCMEKLEFKNIKNENDVITALNKLCEKGIISDDERKVIDHKKIYNFFTTDIGQRIMAHANSVRREFSFKYLEDASVILNIDTNEKIIVQGTIDLFFEDDDGSLVLLDYKSDRVRNGNPDSVVKGYLPQIECYSRALEKIMNKKVKEKIIYLFDIDTQVSL